MPMKQRRATKPESQELKENPKKMIKGQRRLKPTTLSETSRPCNITTNNSSVLASAATFFESYTDNSCKTIPLTTIHPHHQPPEGIFNTSTSWSLNSMVAILPTSPSPVCSRSSRENSSLISPSSDRFFSQASSQSPTPRNQVSGAMKFWEMLNENTRNSSHSLEPKSLNNTRVESEITKQDCSPKRSSFSSRYESAVTAIDYELASVALPSVWEERSQLDFTRSNGMCDIAESLYPESSLTGHHRLMTRPKPYHAFLDEIKRQEVESQKHARTEDIRMRLMEKLRKKEAAICEWEYMQTKKAMSKLEEVEKKIEKVHIKAKEKAQRKVNKAQMKADQQKAKERRSTIKKISAQVRQTESAETCTCTCFNLLRSF